MYVPDSTCMHVHAWLYPKHKDAANKQKMPMAGSRTLHFTSIRQDPHLVELDTLSDKLSKLCSRLVEGGLSTHRVD